MKTAISDPVGFLLLVAICGLTLFVSLRILWKIRPPKVEEEIETRPFLNGTLETRRRMDRPPSRF